MVVKSATKKKLMDLGIAENFAHTLADDKKWDDVKILAAGEIAQLCETDSETRCEDRRTSSMQPARKVAIQTVKTPDHTTKFPTSDARDV